jgi:Ca2+/Na+ antiporter
VSRNEERVVPAPDTDRAEAGLPGAPEQAEAALRRAGIDPDRLSIQQLGAPAGPRRALPLAPAARLGAGLALWITGLAGGAGLPDWATALLDLAAGLLILQVACDLLVTATERMAALLHWDHYVAGTAAEILATLPEFAVIAFLVPVSPLTAFVTALITIYNNAIVFSVYSYFLPKDRYGRFLMPQPITEAGTQILVAGAAIGLVAGLVMVVFSATDDAKSSFAAHDLIVLGVILLVIFAVYVFKLLRDYAAEEQAVRTTLDLSDEELVQRRERVYVNVHDSSLPVLSALLVLGIASALLGGHLVASFAGTALADIGLNGTLTALIIAASAGMSEYVILWKAHQRGEYGIALANGFGGITQVMFLVVPATLIAIGLFQLGTDNGHPELPLAFSLPNVLLLLFLFPTFFVLIELLEEDHTLGLLDTVIMTSIFGLLVALLVTYGAHPSPPGQRM